VAADAKMEAKGMPQVLMSQGTRPFDTPLAHRYL